MSELHSVSVFKPVFDEESRPLIETADPKFIQAGMLRARDLAWRALEDIARSLQVGMTELEARKMALEIFQSQYGIKKHWHQPYIRLGPGTLLTFAKPLQTEYRLQEGDPVFVDLGPAVWDEESGLEYEADVGKTWVFLPGAQNSQAQNSQAQNSQAQNSQAQNSQAQIGKPLALEASKLANLVSELHSSAVEEWRQGKTGAELYKQIQNRVQAAGLKWVEEVTGHRVADFPHRKYTREVPGSLTVQKLQIVPVPGLWVLEIQVAHPTLPIGAFYEDLLI